MSTTDLIGAMFGNELELALLQINAPGVAGFVYHWTNDRTVSTTDLIGAMISGELELALLQVDAPDVAGFVHH